MTEPGAEAPIRPVLAARTRTRERARILVVGVIAVVVFGAGIGLAGNGITNQALASASPSRPAPTSTMPGEPSPTDEPTRAAPAQNVGFGCAPVRLGAPPEIRVSSDAGSLAPVTGVAATSGPTGSATLDAAWPIPGAEGAARLLDAAALLLAPDDDACVRYVIADYRPADPRLKGPFPIAFRTLNVTPPRAIVPLGPMPTGDWVVRVVAYFWTGVAGQEDANVIERFFRVIAGEGAGPLPSPATPPAVPCAAVPASAPIPDLVLYGASEGPTVGIPPGTGTPQLANAMFGAPLEIRDARDVCARSWSITAHLVETGENLPLGAQENPTSDPFRFAQNRWRLLNVSSGLLQITATMDYSADVQIIRRWSVAVYVPAFPSVRLLAPDGSSILGAPGCGATWAFPAGTGGTETCTGPAFAADALETLTVKAGSPIRLDVPDWTIVNWSGVCGRFDEANQAFDPFVQVDNCDLGGAQVPGPAVFLPRPNAPLVRLFVVLEHDGVTASASIFASVVASP